MSNNNTALQAQRDAEQQKRMADMQNRAWQERQRYEAEYRRKQEALNSTKR